MPGLTAINAPPPFELWLATLDADTAPSALASLSTSELDRAKRFVFARDRRRYLAAHCALRNALIARTGLSATALEIVADPLGKPRLAGGAPACSFNLSHSEDFAVIALAASGDIGVDIEVLRSVPDARALAEQNYTRTECIALACAESSRRDLLFLLAWTRKEACLKAIGSGLTIAPSTFECGLFERPSNVMIQTDDGATWIHVQSFVHDSELVVSLARVLAAYR
jgi:4'-phosphopantetheinyl transferase